MWCNISVYVASYLHAHDDEITLQSVAPIFTMFAVAHGFTNPVGPFLLGRMSARWVLTLGCAIALVGVTGSSFTTSLWGFALTFTLTFGLGIGMCYTIVLILGWEHYPERKGMVSGLVVGGFGFGSFMFGFVALAIVNPEDKEPDLATLGGKLFTDPDIVARVPWML